MNSSILDLFNQLNEDNKAEIELAIEGLIKKKLLKQQKEEKKSKTYNCVCCGKYNLNEYNYNIHINTSKHKQIENNNKMSKKDIEEYNSIQKNQNEIKNKAIDKFNNLLNHKKIKTIQKPHCGCCNKTFFCEMEKCNECNGKLDTITKYKYGFKEGDYDNMINYFISKH